MSREQHQGGQLTTSLILLYPGMSMAEFYYANLLFIGRGCQADMDEAYKYYKRSYEHGLVQSKIMMDKIDRIGRSVFFEEKGRRKGWK